MCDFGGVEKSMIKRLGRGNADCMSSSYVNGLSSQAMGFLSGYGTQQGTFYLPWSGFERPAELQAKVFPQVMNGSTNWTLVSSLIMLGHVVS